MSHSLVCHYELTRAVILAFESTLNYWELKNLPIIQLLVCIKAWVNEHACDGEVLY